MTSYEELESQIEKLVQDFLSQSQAVVKTAVERAFRSASPPHSRPTTPRRSPERYSKRRSSEEMETLSTQLYQAVRAMPGETIKTLSAQIDATPRALQLPVARLKKAGLIRTVGKRQFTTYFPMAADSEQR